MKPLSKRKEAKQKTEKWYYTGIPCIRGHITKRLVSNGWCWHCAQEKAKRPKYKAKHKLKTKLWAERNKEYRKEYNRNWSKANPENNQIKKAKRRAKQTQAGGFFTKQEILDLLKKQHKRCVACTADISICRHVDHIVPISKGGTSFITNIQLLCPRCNLEKKDKNNNEFMRTTLAGLL